MSRGPTCVADLFGGLRFAPSIRITAPVGRINSQWCVHQLVHLFDCTNLRQLHVYLPKSKTVVACASNLSSTVAVHAFESACASQSAVFKMCVLKTSQQDRVDDCRRADKWSKHNLITSCAHVGARLQSFSVNMNAEETHRMS